MVQRKHPTIPPQSHVRTKLNFSLFFYYLVIILFTIMNSQLELAKQLHSVSVAYHKYKVCNFAHWFFLITNMVSILILLAAYMVMCVCMGDIKFTALRASDKISMETLHYGNSTLNYYNTDQTLQYFNYTNHLLMWIWNTWATIFITAVYSMVSWCLVNHSESKIKKYKAMYTMG
jgi:hypothetical protein